MSLSEIKFGTDGWRALIGYDFTFENVRHCARAIAAYIHANEDPAHGICIGYDTRFGSPAFARCCAEVVSATGIPVYLANAVTPTPALSFGVRERGAAGGIMITSSHNPAQWNGVKYKAKYGGSGSPRIIAEIESFLGKPVPAPTQAAPITMVDFLPTYLESLKKTVDFAAIARSGFKFAVDSMYGTGGSLLQGIFDSLGVAAITVRANPDPLFPGINPEPIERNMGALQQAVVEHGCSAGLCTDGDADRIGATDEQGNYVDANKIFCVLEKWAITRKGWPGVITRAFNTTGMIDRIAAKYGRELVEHGIGFKHVCDLMLEREVMMGGEEAGGIGFQRHLPERDGLLNALLLANVMADEGKTLGQLVAELQQEFGHHEYDRIALTIPDAQKSAAVERALALKPGDVAICGMKLLRTETMEGVKLYLENPAAAPNSNAAETWIMLRASGTEPILRIYSESISKADVARLLQAGSDFALSA